MTVSGWQEGSARRQRRRSPGKKREARPGERRPGGGHETRTESQVSADEAERGSLGVCFFFVCLCCQFHYFFICLGYLCSWCSMVLFVCVVYVFACVFGCLWCGCGAVVCAFVVDGVWCGVYWCCIRFVVYMVRALVLSCLYALLLLLIARNKNAPRLL